MPPEKNTQTSSTPGISPQAEKILFLREAGRRSLISFAQITSRNYEATWFHEIIASVLERALECAANGKKMRIILTVPPRHGKTELSSIKFSTWALGKYPHLEFILSTYGAELSEKIGMKARDLVNSEEYQMVFPGIELRQDQKAKAKWMTNKGGSFLATGIGGAVTGSGANCVVGESVVITKELGPQTISTLYRLQHKGEVLSFNHATHKSEWKKILAYSKTENREVITIEDSTGNSITCTPDHRIFRNNVGYIGSKEVRKGDEIIITEGVLHMQRKEGPFTQLLQKVLRSNERNSNSHGVFYVSEKIREDKVRSDKTNKKRNGGLILLTSMFRKTSRIQKQQEMFNVQHSVSEQTSKILLEEVQTEQKNTKGYNLSCVSDIVRTTLTPIKILWGGMQKRTSQCVYERNIESKIQSRNVAQGIPKGVQKHQETYNSFGQRVLCSMWKYFASGSSPYRYESEKQHTGESSNTVCGLSYSGAQGQVGIVTEVTGVHSQETVYDIQVEDNNNFFCNNILVHNCIIIDDPHKSREEAESATVRDTVHEYYRDTLYSRLEGFGVVIMIMQRWHTDDLVGRVLEDAEKQRLEGLPYDEWEIINLPAIAEEDEYWDGKTIRYEKNKTEDSKLVRKVGEPLWKEKFGLDVLANIRAQSLYKWSSQYQQNPISSETQEFKEHMFKKWKKEDLDRKYLRYFTFVDPAISQKKEGDNTVVLTVAKEVDGPNIYRIREDAGHFTPQQTIDLVFMHQKMFLSEVHIETVAYQAALKFSIMEEQKKRQQYFILEDIKTSSNKELRIRGLLPLYSAGVLWHMPVDHAYEQEALVFPKGKHDDRIDCMSFFIAIDHKSGGGMKKTTPKWRGHSRR
jgi:hypothetical protein